MKVKLKVINKYHLPIDDIQLCLIYRQCVRSYESCQRFKGITDREECNLYSNATAALRNFHNNSWF